KQGYAEPVEVLRREPKQSPLRHAPQQAREIRAEGVWRLVAVGGFDGGVCFHGRWEMSGSKDARGAARPPGGGLLDGLLHERADRLRRPPDMVAAFEASARAAGDALPLVRRQREIAPQARETARVVGGKDDSRAVGFDLAPNVH